MAEIVPSILVKNFDEFRQKFEMIKNLVRWVQLDVADGAFAPNKTWGDPTAIKAFDREGTSLEVHLMVADSEKEIEQWLHSGVERVYFHYESAKSPDLLASKLKSVGIKPGIALLSDTPIEKVIPLIGSLDAVLLFSGKLGFYGGEFNEDTVKRIANLREISPDIIIEVDGGINPETAKKCVEAGADMLVAGSYIFNSSDVETAIRQLQVVR